ncbi:MAG TPA: hypothetical protein P5328_00610 [Candidatus Paceibacterota bacterium]|nr:hypothetical protein [Candidatus Paceibacterota bacterium]HRZ34178.1 hypothetical protein [Candidatus Paceibacterota bacterium]
MNYFEKKDTNRIGRLEKKLFSKGESFNDDVRSGFDKKQYEETRDWDDGDLLETELSETIPIKKPKTGIFWGILALAVIFFTGSLGYAVYRFVGGDQIISTDQVDIDVIGPVSVGGGDRLSIDVVVQNNSSVDMQSANLVINYPDGTRSVDLQSDLRRGRIDLGDIKVGSVVKKTLDMAFLGENGEVKSVDVSVEYRTSGSVVLLSKTKTFTIILSASPVQILVTAPDKISSGQNLELDLEIKSNSDKIIENLLVVAEYPFGFAFNKASINPTYGDNVWLFNSFSPTDVKNIKIQGQLQAQDNEERSFKFSAGTPDANNKEDIGITLTNIRHTVLLEKPFIGIDVVINGSSGPVVAVKSGEAINYSLVFSNNTNDTVRDVKISLFFEGQALNKSKVVAVSGFYDSYENKISYTGNSLPELNSVLPRSSVSISDKFETYDLSANNRNLVNPEIRISAIVTGTRISDSEVEDKIEERGFITIKLLSDLTFGARTSYNSSYTSAAGFTDTGPVPPKVEQETVYTVTWALANSVNDLETTKVIGLLPSYVTWLGSISPADADISYDGTSRRVIWSPNKISAGTGYTAPFKTISFQLKLRPSLSQVGQIPNLVEKTTLSAFDTFTKSNIEKSVENTTTVLAGYTASDGYGNVVQ